MVNVGREKKKQILVRAKNEFARPILMCGGVYNEKNESREVGGLSTVRANFQQYLLRLNACVQVKRR